MGMRVTGGFICALALAACGGGGGSGDAERANLTPLAVPDVARTRPGVAVDIAVLANDSDPDGDPLTLLAPVAPPSGSVELLAGNLLRVTPAAGFAGDLSFTYQVRDGRGALSSPASVTVTVGPVTRAMLGISSGSLLKVVIAGPRPGDAATLFEGGPCGFGPFASVSFDMRILIGTQCGTLPTRQNLVMMAPRAPTLAAPVMLLADAALAPGFIMSPDGNTVTVAERIGNPDDLSLPGTYELVRVDVASRSVTARLALPAEVETVQSISRAGGVDQRILVATGNGAIGLPGGVISAIDALYLADFTAGTVVQVDQAGGPPMTSGALVTSPDGRYVFTSFLGNVSGYDLDNPGVPIDFWSSAARGEMAELVMPAPTLDGKSMLIVTGDFFSVERAIWVMPADDPAAARELVRYNRLWTPIRAPAINGTDRLLVASDGAAPEQSEIREFRVSTGEVIATLTPAGGVPLLQSMQRLGNDALLVGYLEVLPPAASRQRFGILRAGQLTVVAPDLDHDNALTGLADFDGTTFGFTTVIGGVFTPYLIDVNLPAHPFPFSVGVQPGENANVAAVFLPPDS